MKDETKSWLRYADENFQSARVLIESRLYNPCIHNIQQAVEKWLKAALVELSIPLKKTHSISELKSLCLDHEIAVGLSDEECEFLDSIYLPSKYPLGSALPNFEPNEEVCRRSISIAEKVRGSIAHIWPRQSTGQPRPS